MQSFVQPLLQPPCIVFELLRTGDTAKVESQFSYKGSYLICMELFGVYGF
jgi:hypothetical protein